VTRRLAVSLACSLAACGGPQRPATLVPQSPNEALKQFMEAVNANDLTRMGNLFGSDRGPASSFQDAGYLRNQLTTIQIYLKHSGYRIIEGPIPAAPLNPTFKNVPGPNKLRDCRIELQRGGCNHVLPITLVRTNSGSWLVYDVHLESAGNPSRGCRPEQPGTRP